MEEGGAYLISGLKEGELNRKGGGKGTYFK